MTFDELNSKILALQTLPGVEFFTIGYSVLNQPIYALHIGSYEGKQIQEGCKRYRKTRRTYFYDRSC